MINKNILECFILVLIWGTLIIVDAWIRPLIPSNELHHASIAWEMYLNKHFLVPIQTGHPYAEKTPLLYWLIHSGWFLFGVNSWWIRLIPQLFMLASLFITRALATRLFPAEKNIALRTSFILLGCIAWSLEIHITWFDMMIIFFALLSWYYLYLAITQGKFYWLFFGMAMGGGVLAKGPVIFIFALSPVIFIPWWAPQQNKRSVYLKCFGAFILAILMGLCWALPAALQGGKQYAQNLFLTQSIGRINGHHGISHHWQHYLQFLPVLLLPWILWTKLWKSGFLYFRKQQPLPDGLRFLLPAILLPLLLLSLFATKSYGYYFPCLPLITIFLAYLLLRDSQSSSRNERILMAIFYSLLGIIYLLLPYLISIHTQEKIFWLRNLSPIWGVIWLLLGSFWFLWNENNLNRVLTAISLSSVLFCIVIQIGINRVADSHNDWRDLSLKVRALQDQGISVAFPRYVPEELFEFYGQLNHPLVINPADLGQWVQDHPHGWLIIRNTEVSPTQYFLRAEGGTSG